MRTLKDIMEVSGAMNTEHRRTIRVYLNPDNPAREQRYAENCALSNNYR